MRSDIKKSAYAAIIISVFLWGGSPDSGAPRPLPGNFLEIFAMTSAAGYLIAVCKLSSR